MKDENEKIFLRCNPIKTDCFEVLRIHHPPPHPATSMCPLRLFTLSHLTLELQVLPVFYRKH